MQRVIEESVEASQSQTTISSEAEISRQQRSSQEPSSEFSLGVAPFESNVDVAPSDSQLSIVTVHVDSSESLLAESITQSSSSVQYQREEGEAEEGEEEEEEDEGTMAAKAPISSGSEGERPVASVVVGVVEPERASFQTKSEEQPQARSQQQEQGSRELEEDREAISDTRGEKEEETAEEESGMEGAVGTKDATKEQADTTQKLEEGIYVGIRID